MHLSSPKHGLIATSAVVASTIPLAVGAALANAQFGSEGIAVTFFGDGAVEEGVFWESLNFASLKQLKVLFVCEDNGLAIHALARDRRGFKSIPEAIQGFNCHVGGADGADVNAVAGAAESMLRKMAEAPRPGFLHFPYFRFLEHVGISEDFSAGYRERPAPDEFRRLDPVIRFEEFLLASGHRAAELDTIKSEVNLRIDDSVSKARQAPFPCGDELWTDVFA